MHLHFCFISLNILFLLFHLPMVQTLFLHMDSSHLQILATILVGQGDIRELYFTQKFTSMNISY